jgi:hypothetical protein
MIKTLFAVSSAVLAMVFSCNGQEGALHSLAANQDMTRGRKKEAAGGIWVLKESREAYDGLLESKPAG